MFDISTPSAQDCGVASVVPHTALILSHVNNGGDLKMLLAQHTLYSRDGQVRMGSGQVIGPERLAEIVNLLDENAARHASDQFLPAHVIAQGSDMVAWHVPARRRPMFFAVHDEGTFSLDVIWPALLFVARGSRLWLAALDSDERPGPDAPVYHAPLMNHDPRSGLCFGSAPMPGRAYLDTMSEFESAVFESNFSHVNGCNHLRYRHLKSTEQHACTATHLAFYRALEKRRLKRFPTRHLLPMNCSVARFLTTGAR